MNFLDELAHYAKPLNEGGKNLTIRMVIGPRKWVRTEIRRYLTHEATSNDIRRRRKAALDRVAIRQWGRDPTFNQNVRCEYSTVTPKLLSPLLVR